MQHYIGIIVSMERLDINVLQCERTRSTGHVWLPSNQYKGPTNRYKLGFWIDDI